MEVDDNISTPEPARKFSRVNSNGSRIDSSKITPEPPNPTTITTTTTTTTTTDLVTNRLRQWPHHQSRIIRVSRASGGKDRHSKVWTARGPRDRRVRLSVNTAIQFYDLQDRLGFEQPSKAVEWLIKAAADAINELPSLDTCATFPPETPRQLAELAADLDPGQGQGQGQNPKSGCCSSNNSENSKGSGLSLSRTEIRVKARERARERTAKEKEKEVIEPAATTGTNTARVHVSSAGQHHQAASSFTQLLTAGISSPPASSSPPDVGLFHKQRGTTTTTSNQWLASNTTAMDYFGTTGSLLGARQMHHQHLPQAMVISSHGLNHNHHQDNNQHYPYVSGGEQQQHLIQVGGGGGNVYNFNFSISPSSTTTGSSGLGAGYNNTSRGTLQSNSSSSPSLFPYLHRFSSTTDGSSSVPFFLGGAAIDEAHQQQHQFQPPGLQLCYGDGTRHADHKGKTKN